MKHNPNLRTLPFGPDKPMFEESTLRLLQAFVTGLCLRYLMDGGQLSLSRGFGEVMNGVTEYSNATFEKVARYLRDEVKLDGSFSDHQVLVAEAAKLHFFPASQPLSPGNIGHGQVGDAGMLYARIRIAFAALVANLPGNDASLSTYTTANVEFDMGTMEGPHNHKYPGFRAMLLQPKGLTYTHHFLIQKFTTKEDLKAYADMMTGGDTSMIHVFDNNDVATAESLTQMFVPTVMTKWRELTSAKKQ